MSPRERRHVLRKNTSARTVSDAAENRRHHFQKKKGCVDRTRSKGNEGAPLNRGRNVGDLEEKGMMGEERKGIT